jgi:hypothetical protein
VQEVSGLQQRGRVLGRRQHVDRAPVEVHELDRQEHVHVGKGEQSRDNEMAPWRRQPTIPRTETRGTC